MSLLDELLHNLKSIKEEEKQTIRNSKEVWAHIGNRDWQAAGFDSAEEAQSWLENNDYSAIS